ncbi:MAG: AsmA family protein [Acidobacteria bacterium]|nr:AsmA family protein [Acidobacteriota bacterium]
MKLIKYILGALVVLVLVVAGAGAWLINSALSADGRARLVAEASKVLGVPVGLKGLDADVGALLRLKPSVVLTGLTVANPPGFSSGHLLEADRVTATVDFSAVLDKKIRMTSATIEEPRIIIESAADGRTNLSTILDGVKAKASDAPAGANAEGERTTELRVDRVDLIGGTVLIAARPGQQPRQTLRDLTIRLSDFVPGQPFQLQLSSKLYDSPNSSLTVGGFLGPLAGGALPLDAKAAINLALAEIPAPVRMENLGELAADPGPQSSVALLFSLKGNLSQSAQGTGQLTIKQLQIGPKDAQGRLALSGQAPLAFSSRQLLAGGPVELRTQKASLQLGSGKWEGGLHLISRRGTLAGTLDGAIESVDVNQMLTSFAGSPGKLFGTLSVPLFSLRFSGNGAAALQKSLAGRGHLEIDKGRMKGLNVLAAIERALATSPTGPQNGEFARLATDFTVENSAIQLSGINLTGPGMTMEGAGSINFSTALNFALTSRLTGNTAEALRARTAGLMAGDLKVPLRIDGTLDAPQVHPEVKAMAKSAAVGAVKGILNNFFGSKQKK